MTRNLHVRMQLASYKRKAETLRQIHSNKQRRYQVADSASLYGSIALSIVATFLGFIEPDVLQSVVPWQLLEEQIVLGMQVSLLLLLVVVVIAAAARLGDKRHQHHRSIVVLTHFIRDVDDAMKQYSTSKHDIIGPFRERYKMITEFLPPSSDREYERSKKDYARKKQAAMKSERGTGRLAIRPLWRRASVSRDLAAVVNPEDFVRSALASSPAVTRALNAAADLSPPDWWLTGGVIRTTVWSQLTGRDGEVDDLDLVFFDTTAGVEQDDMIERYLAHEVPGVKWDVKNQARMHERHGDDPYANTADAIAKFPETATAWGIRYNDAGHVEIVAPHGLADLVRMIIRPTPHAAERHPEDFLRRLNEKSWQDNWPEAVVLKP